MNQIVLATARNNDLRTSTRLQSTDNMLAEEPGTAGDNYALSL
jgi:hypothetical protein